MKKLISTIILAMFTLPVFAQTVEIEGSEVVIRIKIQVEGMVSGADTTYITLPGDTTYIDRIEYVDRIEYIDRVDTLEVIEYITLYDTTYIDRIEYVDVIEYVDRVDTLYITEFDTTYIDRIEYITEIDTVYTTIRDTLEIVQIDTVYSEIYDTLYYPVHPVVDIAFSDTPPEWRRVDRIILRPVGWAAGRVQMKGSDDPRWTDIEFEVSTGDIWGTGDYFMYMNIPTTEWTYAYAMLDSLQVMDRRARTGLHIRQSYEPGSPFVFLAYQNGRASVNMRNEWGGEVIGHPDGGFEVGLPIGLQVNMTDQGFDARVYDVWTDSALYSWSLPNVFEGKFYTGIATTSWSPALITRAWYSMLNILDAVPWGQVCRDGDGNMIDCQE